MTRRQLRRIFRVNSANNLVIRIVDRPPLEFLSQVKCPTCHKSWYDCGHLDHLTMDQLAEKGFARYVEQV